MTIANKSSRLIIYNPSHTALFSGKLDYKKPLDYSALYLIAEGVAKSKDESSYTGSSTKQLATLTGKYYDLNTRVEAGGKVSKLLLFKPFLEVSKGAVLIIKELYIGTDAFEFSFPFILSEAPSSETTVK